VAAARSAIVVSRAFGHGGSVIGGRALLAIDPDALTNLRGNRPIALVSGTNGKTTTATLLSAALAQAGPVTSNYAGANLPTGIATALALGDPNATAVLEVDEAVIPTALAKLRPNLVVLLNLSRDQLDRYGEVRTTAAAWSVALRAFPGAVVANADDPLVVWPALAAPMAPTWVGAGAPWTGDAAVCPSCGSHIRRAGDHWACVQCPLRRPTPSVTIDGDQLCLGDGSRRAISLRLPGRCNLANAAMAAAGAMALGVDAAVAIAAFAHVEGAGGRYRVITIGGIRARLLLAKNPASWLETLQLLRPAPAPLLIAFNAEAADGRDPSWLWDVPFDQLRGRPVRVTGKRAADVAVRLRYAGVDFEMGPADPVAATKALPDGETDVVANYTAFRRLASLAG
jgi:UDP-N-acetylmuramyl tripeptide synthase